MSRCELNKDNNIDFTDEELSPEDRQAMEDFMKQKAERDCQEVEKLMKKKAEEDRLHYLSHFKKTRDGKVKKIMDITFDTPPPEVPPNVSTSSSPSSFFTVNDLTTVMDSFRLSMIENMQNMVDKSLGKQIEDYGNVASGSKTVAPQIPSINSSVAQTLNPQYDMLLNYFAGQTPPPPFGQNRPVLVLWCFFSLVSGTYSYYSSRSGCLKQALGMVTHLMPKLIVICNITLLAHTHNRIWCN
jgi:hypothetical protein